MKRFAILLVVLGLILVSVSIAAAQAPPDGRGDNPPPPPNGNPHPHDRDGHRDGRNGNNADQTAPTTAVTTTSQLSYFLLGGDNTVIDESEAAFTHPLPGLSEDQLIRFDEGDELFEQAFVAADGDDGTATDDGLGPFFNATSCEACHVEDGRGQPPLSNGEGVSGFLIRLALDERNLDGSTMPDPIYGGQLQDLSIEGLEAEGVVSVTYTEIPGTFADGTPYSLRMPTYQINNLAYGDLASDTTFSPRVANQMIGLGLLEAISEETILSFADPTDEDGDGISGRPNYVWDAFNNLTALGRFGWKANQPHLLQQTAAAYNGDMGISTSLFGHQPCTELQADCLALPTGGTPEASDEDVLLVTFYSSTLSVPAQRTPDDPLVQQGAALFEAAQCSSCHIPELTTGVHASIPELSNQTIHPFTDLLLHDMGEALGDGQADFQATGTEWRTPPLWGIGLFETVNGHTFYLHDGRARDLNEAILWHGGEATTSRDFYLNLSATEREALLAFLRSL